MREIKFRAWDIVNKKMHIDDFALGTDNFPHTECDISIFYPSEKKIIIMQFTGLKDKNGEEIYEGDIVEYTDMDDSKKFTGIVSYDTFNFSGFYIEEILQSECTAFGFYNKYEFKPIVYRNLKVVGNIYNSPELLEVKK